MPRVALIHGIRIAVFGRNAKQAAIAADLDPAKRAHDLERRTFRQLCPRVYPPLSDMEDWPLDQAKRRKAG